MTSKKAPGAKEEQPDPNNMTLQRQERMKKLQMDQDAVNQEEEFFQKWLKQRENLGDQKVNTTSDTGRNLSSQKAPGSVKKPKDVTGKELQAIDNQLRKDRIMKNYSVEKRAVRKAINVNTISAATIEAFIKYLDIAEEDTEYDTNKKLNAANTLEQRKHKPGQGAYDSRASAKKPAAEEDLNDRLAATQQQQPPASKGSKKGK